MKMKIGPYTVRSGKYPRDLKWAIREFVIEGPGTVIDIDWTDNKFPIGWCTGFNFGHRIWHNDDGYPDRGPVFRWGSHWSWNAPFGEPNRLSFSSPAFTIRFSCFTWWKEIVDSVEEGPIGPTGKRSRVMRVHRERSWPQLEDGWPLVKFQRDRYVKGSPGVTNER